MEVNQRGNFLNKSIIRTSYYGKKESEYGYEAEGIDRTSEEFNLAVLGDMILLKKVFQSRIATHLMTKVIKIALNL